MTMRSLVVGVFVAAASVALAPATAASASVDSVSSGTVAYTGNTIYNVSFAGAHAEFNCKQTGGFTSWTACWIERAPSGFPTDYANELPRSKPKQ